MNKLVTLLFGGSFNMIHASGHFASIEFAFNTLNDSGVHVDESWFVPAAQNVFKSTEGMALFGHRNEMCRLQARGHKWLGVSGFEGTLEPPYDSYHVIPKFIEEFPYRQFVGMIGTDNLETLHTWDGWEEILHMMPFVAIDRECSSQQDTHYKALEQYPDALRDPSEPFVFDGLPNIRILTMDKFFPGRATDIRRKIKAGEDTPELNPKVRSYIDKHKLYRD